MESRHRRRLNIDQAAVVLSLEVEVLPRKRARFLRFCRKAFPIYESTGGNQMALYEESSGSGTFREIGYYRTPADYERSEKAIGEDPKQIRLIQEWRSLLKGPPRVTVWRRKSA